MLSASPFSAGATECTGESTGGAGGTLGILSSPMEEVPPTVDDATSSVFVMHEVEVASPGIAIALSARCEFVLLYLMFIIFNGDKYYYNLFLYI